MANATAPVIQINEGNVGINESNPSAKLEVDGTINFNSVGDHGFLLNSGAGTFSLGDKDEVGYGNFIESLNGNIDIYNGAILTLRVDLNNKVGIGTGTGSISANLEISDTTLAETRITSYPASGFGGQSNLWLSTRQYGNSMIALGPSLSNTAATASAGIRYNDFTATMTIKTNSSDRLTINSLGTVRILGSGTVATLEIGSYGGKITSNFNTLETNYNFKVNGAVIVKDLSTAASSSYAGALRYRVSGNNSYVDMCMQTGASTYAWTNIVQNQW
tara:strand:+ start:263 stop:1087 length:825 start_codon:yes stop_codon:yes gene_type:complete